MRDRYLLLFESHNLVKGTEVDGLDGTFVYKSERFSLESRNAGEFSHLLNDKGDLVGFYLFQVNFLYPELLLSSLVKNSRNVIADEFEVNFVLSNDSINTLENDCAQLPAAFVLRGSHNNFLLAIPLTQIMGSVLWNRLGFDLTKEEIPIRCLN